MLLKLVPFPFEIVAIPSVMVVPVIVVAFTLLDDIVLALIVLTFSVEFNETSQSNITLLELFPTVKSEFAFVFNSETFSDSYYSSWCF